MKPMLAGKCTNIYTLGYPVYVSPKLDGVRALVINGILMSRTLKPIPNKYVQSLFGTTLFEGLDGELICGSPTAPNVYRKTMSAVMSVEGQPDVYFHVFDKWDSPDSFNKRYDRVKKIAAACVMVVPHRAISNQKDLLTLEQEYLDKGYEGAMIRAMHGPYKNGRSTESEGWLLKLKRFEDGEAHILEAIELQHNENEATKDELGHTKRSSHKAGMRPAGVLGALKVCDRVSGVEFEIGSGFDAQTRKDLWDRRGEIGGALVKYRFFPGGVKDKPRFPTWLGFRDERDL